MPSCRQRDVLPMPLPAVGATIKFLRMTKSLSSGLRVFDESCLKSMHKQQRQKLVLSACSQIWRFNCICVLNGQLLNWVGPLFDCWEVYTEGQKDCLNHIGKVCHYFREHPEEPLGPVNFLSSW